MEKENHLEKDHFFEEIVKKTKTGITFPKELRDELFGGDKEVYFRLVVPNEKDRIILEILPEEKVKEISEKIKVQKSKIPKIKTTPSEKKTGTTKKSEVLTPNWADYFVYDFENKEKALPILESAFYKFAETPVNLEDAMGRVKYVMVSCLTSNKIQNARLYYAIERFLIDIIKKFDQPNLIDWIFDKIIPNIESNFLHELALLEIIESSLKAARYEKAELYIFYVLKNIDNYAKSEMYNVMNSFKQLVKKLRKVERTEKIDVLLKEKLLEYGQHIEDTDYKIQIIEFLEDLNYIELAYKLAKDVQTSLPADSMKLEEVRKLVNRLQTAPISENKQVF